MTRTAAWWVGVFAVLLGACAAGGDQTDGAATDGQGNNDATLDGTLTDGAPTDGATPSDASHPDGTTPGDGAVVPDGGCPGGLTPCGALCVDLQSNDLNCGACAHGCSTGQVCAAGACAMTVQGLVLSELRPASVPYIELYNGTGAPVDLLNYRVQWSTNGGAGGSITLPTYMLPNGGFVVLRGGMGMSGTGFISLGADLTWTTDIAVRLLDTAGLGLDFVLTGPSTAMAPTGTSWTGPTAPNPTADTDQVLVRAVYSPDTHSAADWSLQSQPSPGTYCAQPGLCGTACVNFDTDQNNCGACGFHCPATQICRDSVCVDGVGHAWLSEYRLSGRPGIEINNPSSMPISLMGYRVQVAPMTGTALSFFLPTRTLAPGGFLMVYEGSGTDDATSVYSGMTMGFGPDVGLSLYDATNAGLDFVRVGASTMTPPTGLSWFGATVTAPSAVLDQSIKRNLATFNTNSAADWVLSGPSTPGYLCNPGLALCAGRCVDRAVDRSNCGACGTACGPQETCEMGACRSIGGVVLSELGTSPLSFEVFNGTAATVNMTGYILNWVADGGSATFNVPAGVSLPSGQILRFLPGAGTSTSDILYMGAGVSVNWTTYIALSILTPANVGVDFVKTGSSPTPAPSGTTWNGSPVMEPNHAMAQALVRNLWSSNTHSATDWTIAATPTPLSYCPSPTASTVMCNSTCTDTQSSVTNCGACGNTCNSAYCVNGQCSFVSGLYHGWASPIAGCTTMGFNAMAATDDGGFYPYNIGDSENCRMWKLAATICTTEPVVYGSPGTDWSCPASGGFTDPLFGTFCAVTNQYACTDCYGACNAACSFNPASLRNCSGGEQVQQ